MAAVNPPGFLQNAGATHTAEQFRNWLTNLIAGKQSATSLIPRGGVHHDLGNALSVTQAGSPNMTVLVKSGLAAIPGSLGSKQGMYSVLNDADTTVTITTAHASLARIDSIVYKVEDQAYTGSNNTSSIVAVAGTPSGSPAAPTLPDNSLELARVAVGAGVTSIVNANITDRRIYLAAEGGIIRCTSTTQPASTTITTGQAIFETDTNYLKIWDGSAFRRALTENYTTLPLSSADATGQNPVTSTTFVTGSPVVGLTFVAPVSGKILVTVTAFLTSAGAGSLTQVSFELRTGGTIGSGTVISAAGQTQAVILGNVVTVTSAQSKRSLITGLTAGSTYNIQTMQNVTGGSGIIFTREVIVEPVLP